MTILCDFSHHLTEKSIKHRLNIFERASDLLEFCKNMQEWYSQANYEKKSEFHKLLHSNFFMIM